MTQDDQAEFITAAAAAEQAYEGAAAAARVQAGPRGIAAPDVYAFLGEAKLGAQALAQTLATVAEALTRSLDHFDVYDEAGDAGDNARRAAQAITEAGARARSVSELLAGAQNTISQQGYHADRTH